MRSDRLVGGVTGLFTFGTFVDFRPEGSVVAGLSTWSDVTSGVTSSADGTDAADSDWLDSSVPSSGDVTMASGELNCTDFLGRPLAGITASGVSSLNLAGLAFDQWGS